MAHGRGQDMLKGLWPHRVVVPLNEITRWWRCQERARGGGLLKNGGELWQKGQSDTGSEGAYEV